MTVCFFNAPWQDGEEYTEDHDDEDEHENQESSLCLEIVLLHCHH